MTDISLDLTGTGIVIGDNGDSQGFEINNLPTTLNPGDNRIVRGYGVIKNADNWTTTDENLTISYNMNGESYSTSQSIHFYSYKQVDYSQLPHPEGIQGDYTYIYKENQNENFNIRIPQTNIYMEKSEKLENFNFKPLYQSAFGNVVIVEHPQSGNTDNYWKGTGPRMWNFFSYEKAGSGSDYTLWSKTEFIDTNHILKSTPTTQRTE